MAKLKRPILTREQRRIATLQGALRRVQEDLAEAKQLLLNATSQEAPPTSAAVLAERQPIYGSPSVNFAASAHILNGVLGYKLSIPLTPADVGLIMIGMKLARLAKSPAHADSLLDVKGYADCHAEVIAAGEMGSEVPVSQPLFREFYSRE